MGPKGCGLMIPSSLLQEGSPQLMDPRGAGRLSKAQNQRREKRVTDGSHSSGRSETCRLLVLRLNEKGGSPLYSSSRFVRSHLRGEWSRPSGFILLPVLSEASRASCQHLEDGAEKGRSHPRPLGAGTHRPRNRSTQDPYVIRGTRWTLLFASLAPVSPFFPPS